MDNAAYLLVALAIAGLLYLVLGMVKAVRRVGVPRFARALGALIANCAAAGLKMSAGRVGKPSASRSEPLDLSGTGGRYNARTGNYDNGQDPYGIYPDDDRRL